MRIRSWPRLVRDGVPIEPILGHGAWRSRRANALTVPEIQQCLACSPLSRCKKDAWMQKQQDFDEHQAQLRAIDQEVASQRQKLDPNDIVGQQVG